MMEKDECNSARLHLEESLIDIILRTQSISGFSQVREMRCDNCKHYRHIYGSPCCTKFYGHLEKDAIDKCFCASWVGKPDGASNKKEMSNMEMSCRNCKYYRQVYASPYCSKFPGYLERNAVDKCFCASWDKKLDGLTDKNKEKSPETSLEAPEKRSRPSKDTYYLNIAKAVSERSTCLRRQYGAIIVKNDEIISTGYNGSPRGADNCCDCGECYRESHKIPHGEQYEKCVSVHAEANAIISAARKDMIGATLYLYGTEKGEAILAEPCLMCERLIKNAGIKEVISLSNSRKTAESIGLD